MLTLDEQEEVAQIEAALTGVGVFLRDSVSQRPTHAHRAWKYIGNYESLEYIFSSSSESQIRFKRATPRLAVWAKTLATQKQGLGGSAPIGPTIRVSLDGIESTSYSDVRLSDYGDPMFRAYDDDDDFLSPRPYFTRARRPARVDFTLYFREQFTFKLP